MFKSRRETIHRVVLPPLVNVVRSQIAAWLSAEAGAAILPWKGLEAPLKALSIWAAKRQR